jgi:hypothetical protein
MFKEGKQYELLLLMRKLRPKEFDMVLDVNEIIRQLPNEEREQWLQEWGELMKRSLRDDPESILKPIASDIAVLSPEQFAKLGENATPEQFAKLGENATPEQFAKLGENATPEQFAKLIQNATPKQLTKLMESATPEQRENAFLNMSDEELERLLKKRAEKGK